MRYSECTKVAVASVEVCQERKTNQTDEIAKAAHKDYNFLLSGGRETFIIDQIGLI